MAYQCGNSELSKNCSNCCEQINYLMKRAVISSHLTEQALEDLEIRIILNGVNMVVSRIRVACCFTQTLRNIKESKRWR